MFNRRQALGAGVPLNWSCSVALTLAEPTGKLMSVEQRTGASDLAADLMETGEWSVPDQGARGTCTAFAVAAAEEIWHFRQSLAKGKGVVQPLSKEFLYSAMRRHSFASVGIRLEEEREAQLLESGATYLSQAKKALETAGVCREELAPYAPNNAINFYQDTFSREANSDALLRIVDSDALVHGIVNIETGPAVGADRIWVPPRDGGSTSQIFAQALAAGSPVVAAFPILDLAGANAWLGTNTKLCGLVRYPSLEALPKFTLKGGHTVCLTAYIPDESDPVGGKFVFRNSYGARDFGIDALHARCGGVPKWRGFGVISAADVEAFCWEFLYRRHAVQERTVGFPCVHQ